jgi:hypothetical protein
MAIKRTLIIRTHFGGNKLVNKTFESEKHLDNYLDVIFKKGNKVIGIYEA